MRNFQRMRQARAIMVAFVRQKNLGFVRQPPERRRMQHPVAVALKTAAGCTCGLRIQPAARRRGACSIRCRPALTGPQSAAVLVRDLEQGLTVVDAYAAEHLEVITADARQWAERVSNAGCIFVGTDSPVSLGDYCAGSNHVLPTGCTARHASGLSVQSFLKGVHLVEYTHEALAEAAPHVLALSAAEDLPAHGAAVSVRLP